MPTWALLGMLLSSSCNKDGSNSSDSLQPPELLIEGATNTEGREFSREEDDAIRLACDPRLTVSLGPSTVTEGLLDNWIMRPRGNCSESYTQCGYVRVEAYGEGEEPLFSREAAGIYVVLPLNEVDVGDIEELRASLIDGQTDEVYEVVDEETEQAQPVTDSWTVSVRPGRNCSSTGGNGGAGMGGSVPGGAGPGGLGPGGAGGAQTP